MAYTYLRGDKFRISSELFVDTRDLLDFETGCKLSIGTSLEDESTKDDTDNGWDNQSVSTKNWNVTADAKITNDGYNAANLLIAFINEASSCFFDLMLNGSVPLRGRALLTQLDIDAQVKQDATLSVTFTGVGALE